jgi:hypothetical protein
MGYVLEGRGVEVRFLSQEKDVFPLLQNINTGFGANILNRY